MQSNMLSSDAQARSRRKLPAKYNSLMLPFFLSLFMTAIISAITTLLNVGFAADVMRLWLLAWASSWVIGFPTLLVVLPLVRRLVGALVEQPGR
jgi:hypothetical protein